MTVHQPPRAEIRPYFDRLKPAYRVYCQNVSKRAMALSIETCAYVWYLCDQLRARYVCDLGSGFSSYVLRAYAAEAEYQPVHVDSVDSDAGWLEKSRMFSESQGQTGGSWWTGEQWANTINRYDVIVNDYDKGPARDHYAWLAASRLTPMGAVVFDDANNIDHHQHMAEACIEHGLTLCDLYHQTVDEVNRYAMAATRLRP